MIVNEPRVCKEQSCPLYQQRLFSYG